MAASARMRVENRAHDRCEYCQLPQGCSVTPHEVDHIRAQKHGGGKALDNLAFACFYCNSYKGPNVAGYDPETNTLQPLFNPRRQEWKEHFEWHGAELIGKTAIGRATIDVLRMNLLERIEHRQRLMQAGRFFGS